MRRGEIWTIAGAKDYAGKPRPAVIVQDDKFETKESVTICPLTSDPSEAPLIRLPIEPDDTNGLRVPCRLMADKITTVPRTKLGTHIGRLGDQDIVRLNRAMFVFLGLANASGEARTRRARGGR